MELTPEQKKFFDRLMDLAKSGKSVNDAIVEIVQQVEDVKMVKALKDAVAQVEKDLQAMPADIEKKLSKIRQTAWDANGHYRGVFGSEDEARAFGLLMMGKARGWDSDCDALAKRATEALKRDYPDLHKRAMDSTGDGALITPEFSSRLVRLVERFGVFEANAFIMPMSSDQLTFLRRTGGMTVFLVGENQAGSESEPTYGNVSLNAKEWGTLTYVPKTLDEDSAAEIGELIATEIAQAFAEKTDDIGFNGDGSATHFGIVGVRTRLTQVNGVDDGGGLVLGSGNAWNELTLADHEKAMGVLPDYAADNAAWYVSRPYFFNVMVRLMLAAGGVTAAEIEGRRQLVFGGDPVRITQKMPRAEANSQVAALYGDLRRAATVGRRRSVMIETSRDYKFAERQITYLGTARKAINVHEVGTDEEAGPIVGLITDAA